MVIKKTVAIHPIMDNYIRKMWARLIEAGYDASYSTALNYMLLEHILSVGEDGISKKVAELLNSFLEDEETVEALDLEDYAVKVDELLARRNRLKEGQ